MADHVKIQSDGQDNSGREAAEHTSTQGNSIFVLADGNSPAALTAAPGLYIDHRDSALPFNLSIIHGRSDAFTENMSGHNMSLEISLAVSSTFTNDNKLNLGINETIPLLDHCDENVFQQKCSFFSPFIPKLLEQEQSETELINEAEDKCNGCMCDISSPYCKGAKPKKLRQRPNQDLLTNDSSAHKLQSTFGGKNMCTDDVRLRFPAESTFSLTENKIAHFNGSGTDEIGNRHVQCMKKGIELHQTCSREEDLIDEGAVCDFDRSVFSDEHLIDTEYPGGLLHQHTNKKPYLPYLQANQVHQPQQGEDVYEYLFQQTLSDNEPDDSLFKLGAVGVSDKSVQNRSSDSEEVDDVDNGDFIDTDFPAIRGQLLSSSADSTSLSSDSADLQNEVAVLSSVLAECSVRNDLSVGFDKELKQDKVEILLPLPITSLNEEVFENILECRDLSKQDAASWNSSESENDEGPHLTTLSEKEIEGAGVAEASVPFVLSSGILGEPQFGAGGDLTVCFHSDRAYCLPEQWHTLGCHDFLQSASRHLTIEHSQKDLPPQGETGGTCAPLFLPVNNLNRLHHAMSGLRPGETHVNGLDDVKPCNFNDKSNHQQKVFEKFTVIESQDGACGSEACQDNNENDSILYSCPIAPAPGSRAMDLAEFEPYSLSLNGTDVKQTVCKNPVITHQLRTNCGSGVSEAHCIDLSLELSSLHSCFFLHNSLDQRHNENKETKRKQIICHPMENGLPSVKRIMVWSEYEAYLLQVKQIGISACGQTAVLNILKAFEIEAEKDDVCNVIQVNLRKEKASIADYLASRAVAGTTAEDLLSGVECLTKGEICGRFFPMWPPRRVHLLAWMSHWMKQGAVPIATLNLQKGLKQQQIPDAWHHQMVYGVGPRGVYLTNPLEIVSEDTMLEQLTSDSVLLVRRQDVVSRFQPSASLAPLTTRTDPRWCTMNVLGQVVNVLREHNMPSVPGYRAQVTTHIHIPAIYRAGITLFVKRNSAEWKALCNTSDLPLLNGPSEITDRQSLKLTHQLKMLD